MGEDRVWVDLGELDQAAQEGLVRVAREDHAQLALGGHDAQVALGDHARVGPEDRVQLAVEDPVHADLARVDLEDYDLEDRARVALEALV